ncbi:MAG: DegT/DnrJ/EryC1/StrS family aminotransferase [Bacteroidota bacterium]
MGFTYRIPLSQPSLGEKEWQAVQKVLKSGRLSFGPQVEAFEEHFAQLLGVDYAIAVSSGTAGLHLCMCALGLAPGDEALTSPFSFIASANCVEYVGAKPVFVDIEEESLGMNPHLISDQISRRTRAILPIHVFGQCCNMEAIQQVARSHSLEIIEDACESLLATHKGQLAGTLGKAGVFGFYPNKQITTGEGGMIVTSDKRWATLFKSLRNQGRASNMQWLTHERLGYNYRIHEITAALGLVQLERLALFNAQRAQVANWYTERLSNIEEIQLPRIAPQNTHSWFVYAIRVSKAKRDQIISYLAQKGIQTKAYFFPCIHLQPYYREKYGYKEGDFPIAERVSKESLILPFFAEMTQKQVEEVCETLRVAVQSI